MTRVLTTAERQRRRDERTADKLDGVLLDHKSPRWPTVNRLSRAGLVRLEIHDKQSATIWRNGRKKAMDASTQRLVVMTAVLDTLCRAQP